MDSVLAYMYAMMVRAEENGKPLKRKDLVECGKHVEYLPGVENWFERINRYGEEAGVKVEHYVLSSGLKEIIDGTSIAKHFKRCLQASFCTVRTATPCGRKWRSTTPIKRSLSTA